MKNEIIHHKQRKLELKEGHKVNNFDDFMFKYNYILGSLMMSVI